jgi:HEAT repeat protein
MKSSPHRVFLSSTTRDLADYRDAVEQAIKRTEGDYVCVRCEDWGARPDAPASFAPEKVRDCGLLILLIGQMYGSTPPDSEISFTELEYETALEADISVLPFLIHPEVYPRGYRTEPEAKRQRLEAFRRRVEQAHGRAIFEKPDDLEVAVLQALRSWERDQARTRPVLLLGEYRAYLRRLYAGLPLAGIPVPLDVTLPLDRVYIKLRALPEQEEAARREAALPSDSDEELPHMLAERLWSRREEWEEAARRVEEARPIPPEEAIARHERLAILGDAGAGKSTLLRHLAWERAGDSQAPLPLLVPLGRADVQVSTTGHSFLEAALDLLTEHKAGGERELLKQVLADAIGEKGVLFLCDGLDEVHLARHSVIAGLQKLAADGQRLVVTSRPLGYERLAGLEHFQVLPLLPQDAEAFTDRWFRALAEARGMPQPKQEGWAKERASWLRHQLEERPGLREMASNPLLLTFLAVLGGDEPQRELPRRRNELYREYVERLFTVWEARRQRDGELSLGRLRGEEARRVALWGLYRTAWHLHRAYYGDEGLLAVRDEVEPLLAQDLMERWEFGALHAEALAAEVLHFWEGAGLLDVYRLAGQEWLAFRHLTFQEYGAGRAITQMPSDGVWAVLCPRLHAPHWRGVVLLTAAILPNASNFIRQIPGAGLDDSLETHIHHHLLLAAACLSESTTVECELLEETVSNLEACLCSSIPRLCEEAAERLIDIGKVQARDSMIQVALRYTSHHNPWTRESAIFILSELEASSEAAIGVYLAYMQETMPSKPKGAFILSDRSYKTLLSIVNLLGRLKPVDGRTVTALVELGNYDHVSMGVLEAIPGSLRALGRPDLASEFAQRMLSSFATIDWQKQFKQQREAYRKFFLMIAELLCEDNTQVNSDVGLAELQSLLTFLDLPEWPNTWIYEIARGHVGLYGKQVLHIAAALLEVEEDVLATQARAVAEEIVKDREIKVVSRLLKGAKQTAEQTWPNDLSSSAIVTLIAALGDDPDWVRYMAAELLSNSPHDERAIDALNRVLENSSNTRARILSVRILGFMKRSDTRTIQNLILALRGDADRRVRAAAAEALGSLEDPQPNVIQALIQGWYAKEPSTICTRCGAVLTPEQRDCPECHIVSTTPREAIIRALGKIAEPSSDVIEIMISALQHPDWGIKRAAEKATTSLWCKDPQLVSQSLITALWQFAEREVDMKGFAETVSRICSQHLPTTSIGYSTTFWGEWLSLAKHPSPSIRRAAISCLGRLQGYHPETTSLLIALLGDQDGFVRDAAYEALRTGVGTIAESDRQRHLSGGVSDL